MSRAAKLTFLSSVLFTTTTIAGKSWVPTLVVFYLKDKDFKARRAGIERDDRKRSQQRIENEAEAMQQEQLRLKYLETQSVRPAK
ncbi:hypothetical protein HDV03_003004 [Kappamyces sp. JEL0829]|nr:hypothetical protein HDV03_003004 [Kappamyces sp. JEL0829]KAJ3367167.1 hypothetical protein HDU91_001624 [Kappamyces sp. JEL0680]